MTLVDADNTQTSRRRLLEAGKALFARFGFEQTSTAIIAREAGTSESQLVRYYKGKAGLLEAIFNDCWAALNQHVQGVVVAATDAREALAGVLETVTDAFGHDADLAYLLLFEGRRIRGGSSEILLSKGFIDFENLLRRHVPHRRQRRSDRLRPPRRDRSDDPRPPRRATRRQAEPVHGSGDPRDFLRPPDRIASRNADADQRELTGCAYLRRRRRLVR
jgi:AcrR family transcriptional regulator